MYPQTAREVSDEGCFGLMLGLTQMIVPLDHSWPKLPGPLLGSKILQESKYYDTDRGSCNEEFWVFSPGLGQMDCFDDLTTCQSHCIYRTHVMSTFVYNDFGFFEDQRLDSFALI